ncbi:DUF3310 domain-containing protein [Streptomyces sp. H27-H5]|uniref:DUF3310 domain-containing protein n=1 Tax=Streptomyces sp. H27-H5 TaxID=2996460 RepID=UPI00226DB75F|nr:DUF3310 domain-containing protein [Streptomyces sp. H27-H5]MCY0963020.1 DUF3310 domain-containing protein [Streptomyces sp. H27-H5]
MKYKAGDEVRITAERDAFKGMRGKVYSVNSHVTAPYPYGVKVYLAGRVDYKAFSDDDLKPWEEPADKSGTVNSPAHYTWLPNGIEVIDLTEHLTFNRGNAVKYICRAGLKHLDTELEDLRKAAWYVQREIQRVEAQRET